MYAITEVKNWYRNIKFFRSLVKLNVSHNQIEDISGFKSLHGPNYRLTHAELHGNRLVSRRHVILCLNGCVNLREITFDVDGAPNPLCNHSGITFWNYLNIAWQNKTRKILENILIFNSNSKEAFGISRFYNITTNEKYSELSNFLKVLCIIFPLVLLPDSFFLRLLCGTNRSMPVCGLLNIAIVISSRSWNWYQNEWSDLYRVRSSHHPLSGSLWSFLHRLISFQNCCYSVYSLNWIVCYAMFISCIICSHFLDYRTEILTGLPQVQSLDFIGRDGESSSQKEVLADIPGILQRIMEWSKVVIWFN